MTEQQGDEMTEQQALDLVKRSDRLSAREGVFSVSVGVIFLLISAVILVTSVAESVLMVVTGALILTIMSLVSASATGALLDRRHEKEHLRAVDAVRTIVKEKFSVELPTAEHVGAYRSGRIIDTPEGRVKLQVHVAEGIQVRVTEKLLPAVK